MNRFGAVVSSRNRWPLLILLLVAGFLVFSAWTFHRAARGASGVIDDDYYRHGLRFNQTLLEQQAAAALGWHLQVELADRNLLVALRDRHQQPVAAARGTLAGGTPDGTSYRLPLSEESPGSYRCQLPATLHGESVVQVDFARAGAVHSQQLLLALP